MTADPVSSTGEQERARLAFDGASAWYDELHTHDPAWRRSRAVTHRVFLSCFRPNDRLLELNCGTGIDALAMAEKGMTVHATDISPGMIATLRTKVARNGLGSSIQAEVLGFDDIGSLDGRVFDGAYSNFDGLNCTSRLEALAAYLGRLIRPGGYFIATVLPDFCFWEAASMLLRLNPSGVFRRRASGGIDANLGGRTFKTYYFSPTTFTRAFERYFTPVRILGLNIFTPPLNHLRAYRLLRPILPVLYWIDDHVARIPPFHRIGDHMIVVLRRKDR